MKLKVFLLLLCISQCLYAMDQSQVVGLQTLPAEVIKVIINHLEFGQTLPEITKNLRIFAFTNKRFHEFINDPRNTQEIIENLARQFKTTPLSVAVSLRTRGANQSLVENKEKQKLSQDLMCFLLDASELGQIGKIRFLLAHIPIELINSGLNNSALHNAVAKGHLSSVEILLAAGANPNRRGTWEGTPLMEAAQNGHVEIAQRLLEAGANISLTDKSGKGALWYSYTSKGSKLSMDPAGVNQQAMLTLLNQHADWKQRWLSWAGY